MDQARANGIDDVAPLSRAEILALEPALSPQLRDGFRVPREFVIDPWSAPTAYLLQALPNGAEVRRGFALLGGSFAGDDWRLEKSAGPLVNRPVVNRDGLYGDRVDQRPLGA